MPGGEHPAHDPLRLQRQRVSLPRSRAPVDPCPWSLLKVISAGTYALVGQSFSSPMDALVLAGGADPAGFRAQQLSAAHVHQADLILGITREHRAAAADLVPGAVRRSFTLREYARLLGQIDRALLPAGSPADRARASLPLAAARRRRAGAAEDDVPDPYRQPPAAYAEAYAGIEQAVRSIANVLNG